LIGQLRSSIPLEFAQPTRSGGIADAHTDQVWEFPEKALAIQWAIFFQVWER
jgi:hypothetical protein